MTTAVLTDRISFIETAFDANGKLPRTADGYAVMECPVARSGIQEYLAAEMGDAFKDRDPASIIRVYRPDSVIFGDVSLASYAHKPLTNDHPPVQVTADNWKQYAIGHTGDEVKVENKRVRVPMMMADATAIAAAEAGKVEWSAGYGVTFDVLPDGVAPDGTLCDAIVTGQKINHIALVDRGRAGPEFRIGDNHSASDDALKENRPMAEVKMQDGGIPFNVADATAEAVVRGIQTARDKAVTDLAAAITARDTLQGEKAVLEQKLKDAEVTPAKLQVLADARAKVIADAKRIAPAIVCDGKTDAEIRKLAVVTKIGDSAAALSDAAIEGAFVALVPVADANEDDIQKVIKDGALKSNLSDYDKAQAAYVARLTGKKDA